MLRDIAEGIAEFIREDEYLRDHGQVSVVVEDKANVGFEVEQAVGSLGVLALVSVTGMSNLNQSPVLQVNIDIQISCFEHPSLNRDDPDTLTAQGVSERIAQILHYHRFPFLVGQMVFKDAGRDDVEDANILRSNYRVQTELGYEDGYFNPSAESTGEATQNNQN